MRCSLLLIWLLVAACSHREVRCDAHLQPINRPEAPTQPSDDSRSAP